MGVAEYRGDRKLLLRRKEFPRLDDMRDAWGERNATTHAPASAPAGRTCLHAHERTQQKQDAVNLREGQPFWKGCHSCGQYPSLVPYRRAGRLVGLAMSASRSCPSSTPSGDDCGRTIHRICKRVPWCESIWVPVAQRLKRFKILGADFRSDHLHDSSSDVLSRTVSLSLPNAIATQRGIARTQAQEAQLKSYKSTVDGMVVRGLCRPRRRLPRRRTGPRSDAIVNSRGIP